jgi:putative acetyltransferase
MPSLSSPRIVPLEEAHIPRLLDLFEQSVRRLGPAHYSPEQVEQWARGAHHPGLASQLREHHGWVIEQDDVPLGFATLSDDGHLSLLYVSPDHPQSCSPVRWETPAKQKRLCRSRAVKAVIR